MARTEIKSAQIKDGEVKRSDLNITTTGDAVVRKIIAGTNVTISSTGVDAGTGDVTINAAATSGLTSLNSQTGSSQTFATGTSGSDFNINSGSNIHTFNIPDASGSNRGLITTGSQSIGGNKTFTNGWTLGANADAGGFKITNLGAPTSTTDAARLLDCQEAAAGFDVKDPCIVATTANITLSGTQTIDGVAVIVGDRVLVKNQTTASQNGIYVVSAGAWTRATDADNTPNAEVTYGMFTFVTSGTVNGQTQWVLTTSGTIVLGTTSLTFTRFGVGLGISTLNSLSVDSQTFATGTSGTDFGISSSGSTHTFNIPDASATARGLITTGSQTIAGAKTLTGVLTSVGIQPTANNTSNIGSTSLAYASTFTRNISSDTSQDLSLQTGGTTRWAVKNDGTLTNPQSGISAIQWTASSSVGRILGASDNTGRLQITPASTPSSTVGPYIDMNASTGDFGIIAKNGFGINFLTSGTSRLLINDNGAIGINTTATSDKVNIAVNVPDTGITIDGIGSGTRSTLTFKSSGIIQASLGCDNGGFGTGSSGALICSSVSRISFFCNGAHRWALNSSGDIVPLLNQTYGIGSGSEHCYTLFAQQLILNNSTTMTVGTNGDGEVFIRQGSIARAFVSNSLNINGSGHFLPTSDNTYRCGGNGYRWASIWAANGTIQTSDERDKNTITNSVLGLDFINALRPVSYKWNIGHNDVSGGTYDEETGEILTEATITPVPGSRTHWGLIAQEVKEAVDAAGVDFGGWVLTDINDPDSQQALRYDQFIAPIIKAIQELKADNDAKQIIIDDLIARVEALENA